MDTTNNKDYMNEEDCANNINNMSRWTYMISMDNTNNMDYMNSTDHMNNIVNVNQISNVTKIEKGTVWGI